MKRQPVSSSNILSVGYDPETKILEVEFRGGAVWQYSDVEENVYEEFISSSSVGKYFSANIRGSYSEQKL